MALHRDYEPAVAPSSAETPGARALMTWYLATYAGSRPAPADLGIHVVKRLDDGGWSLHAEGRAADLGTSPYSRPPWGRDLAETLRVHSRELGVQCVIFDAQIWSGAFPDAGWRRARGHGGHLHVELSTEAAASLTVARIRAEIGGSEPAEPAPATDWTEETIMSLPTVRRGDRGNDVRRSMGLLAAAGYPPANSTRSNGTYDGIAGPGWEAACREWQADKHVRNSVRRDGRGDGIFGRWSWTHALTGDS